jgi:ferredoxin
MPTVEYLSYEVVREEGWDVYDEENFERAEEMDLDEDVYGEFEMNGDENILEAAEREGYDWEFECRAGTCATCAGIVIDGEVEMEIPPILSPDEEEKGFTLTCIGMPKSERVKLLFDAKDADDLTIL